MLIKVTDWESLVDTNYNNAKCFILSLKINYNRKRIEVWINLNIKKENHK